MGAIVGILVATVVFAAVPTAIAWQTQRWHPRLQTTKQRATFHKAIAALAIASTVPFNWGWSTPFLIAIAGATILPAIWFMRSRTPKGQSTLNHAKRLAKEQEDAERRLYE
jgi:hypothetical protein